MERGVRPVLSALAVGLAVLLATGALADAVRKSELYSGSRLFSAILSGDAVELRDLVADRRNVGMLVKFVGAVTSAYIDFELIPVGEADTFAAVFESRPPSITIDRFEYHGKNLQIFGAASAEGEYGEFLRRLRDTARFESVSGSVEAAEQGGVSFGIDVLARTE